MKVKWSKKIAIEHITQMRSPFRGQQAGLGVGQGNGRKEIARRLRETIRYLK